MKVTIVHFNGYFGQSLPTELGLDVNLMVDLFKKMEVQTDTICLTKLCDKQLESDRFYIFGSHQNKTIKKYIDDIISTLFLDTNANCIPPAKFILAHENKGVQCLLSGLLDLGMPEQKYFVYNVKSSADKNFIYKLTEGSGSSGVFIAENDSQLHRKIVKSYLRNYNFNDLVFNLKYKYNSLFKLVDKLHYNYFRRYYLLVKQSRVKTKGFDYKVLIFGNVAYVLKRYVRKNDFRSSGSGNFEFISPDNKLLEFAFDFRLKLNVPYASLDIMENESGDFCCIEFQCAHFGPYTQQYSTKSYVRGENGMWSEEENTYSIESLIVNSVVGSYFANSSKV
jgi:hypothetical protein